MVKKRPKKKSGNIDSTIRAMLLIAFAAVFTLAVLLFGGFNLRRKIAINEARMEELRGLISAEEERTAEIEDLQEYMQSEEYLEQEAKERLGFVRDGEIIFKESK